MVYGAVRITGNFDRLAVFDIDQHPTAAMAHPAVTFDNGIISVNFHLASDVAISEFRHTGLPPFLLRKYSGG